jgi:hypothetical protein
VPNSFAASARALEGPKSINLRYRDEKVFGCELLVQDDMDNTFHGGDPDAASRSTLDSSLPETKAVLRREPGLLRPIYRLMLAQESGEWETARRICDSLPIDRDVVASSYWQAQQWAREVSRGAWKSPVCLVIGLQLSTSTNTGMQSVRDQSRPIRSRKPEAARNYRRCPLVQNQPTLPLACLHTDEYH